MTQTQDDDVTPLEYLVSGLVVLSFGLLYYLINHGSGFLSADQSGNTFSGGSGYSAAGPDQKRSLADYQDNETSAQTGSNNAETQADKAEQQTEAGEQGEQNAAATAEQKAAEDDQTAAKQAAAEQQLKNTLAQQQQQAQQQQAALNNELAQLKAQVGQHKAEIARLKQLEAERAQQAAAQVQNPAQNKQAGFESDLQNLMQNQEKNKAITFDKIYFDPGSAVLKPESQPQIAALAEQLNNYKDTKILIRGHTDNTGSAGRNSLVSLSRSGSMKEALVKLGVAAERIKIEGVGALEPIASNDTEEGREKNRRIELQVIE
ncbi:MAG: OmpA family protein [Thiolinea sp.]